ncbi:cysteine desulfurase family protein [Populibacterium corticicola]|uniref:Cysteine desulfurase family protein n=1 Tax=Populibacterium corticicola TaxID=1812826 RepID=A0ABW5XD86_9MICO
MTTNRSAYFDHAATTPMESSAISVYAQRMAEVGNASSLHGPGRAARRVVEESRESIARAFGARPSELVFTGGGTESDNLALKGMFWSRNQDAERPILLISAIEHHAILDPAEWLQKHEGAQVVFIPVDERGVVDIRFIDNYLAEHGERVACVCVMWANNEIGTVQPIADVVAAAHEYGVPVHCDAVQAAGHLEVDFAESGLDSMAITAHKLGGPVGVGALFVRRELTLTPVIHGGGQERTIRSGTLDVAGIAAFAQAVSVASARRAEESARLALIRDDLVTRVRQAIPSAVLRGIDPFGPDRELRLPGNAHFTFENCEGDSLIYLLDSQGVAASTGSACQAGVPQPSHVLLAMGIEEREARGALRFSLGNTTSAEDVDLLLDVLPQAVERASAAGLASAGISR